MGGKDNVDLMMDNRKLSTEFICFELRIIEYYLLVIFGDNLLPLFEE